MNRRRVSLMLLPALVIAAHAWGAATGFSLTFEEKMPFPKLNQWIPAPGFAAPIGTVEVFSNDTVMITDLDPVNGPSPCDPTTTKTMIMDGTSLVSEVHLRFPMAAKGNLIVFDRMQLGAERSDVEGLRAGIFSGQTLRPEVDLEFRSDGYLYVFGQKVDTGGGSFLRYDNVFANDCPNGIDNHVTLTMFHNLVGGTVVVELATHGLNATTYKLGPFPMPEASLFQGEGIGGMYIYVPPKSGRYLVDGMVCTANAPVILPSGSDEDGDVRKRY